jgi:putative transposase
MEYTEVIRTYHVRHRRRDLINPLLQEAKEIANYAVLHKNQGFISTKFVKHLRNRLPSTIACQILRKYGRGTIKRVTNVVLPVPNSSVTRYTRKDGSIGESKNIEYNDGLVTIKPLDLQFRWNPGREFTKIHSLEIDAKKYMICVSIRLPVVTTEYSNVLGIDLNCGVGRHVAVCANLQTNEVLCLNKQGPNIRYRYYKKRRDVKGKKLGRIMKDIDHKVSRKIVEYARENKLRIAMEDLRGVRRNARRGERYRASNRFVNSWSFYRLQTYIEYKAKEYNIPFTKVQPHYTSQECSWCHVIGTRNGESFICNNTCCIAYGEIRNSDVNASFNIGLRNL